MSGDLRGSADTKDGGFGGSAGTDAESVPGWCTSDLEWYDASPDGVVVVRRIGDGWRNMVTCPDEEKPRSILVWHVYQMCMVYDCQKARRNRFVLFWQEIPDGWISVGERKPGIGDANVLGVVIAKDLHGDVRLRGWHCVSREEGFTHWMPTPRAPDNYKALRDRFDQRRKGMKL